MADLFADMDKILQNEIVERHTFYQLKFFVLGSEPTTQAKLQCCLRELKSRRLQLEALSREVEDLRDQNALLQYEVDRIEGEEPTDESGIDLADKEAIDRFENEREIELRGVRRRIGVNTRQIVELQKKFKYVSEECQFFITAFGQLEAEEKLKPWDDLDVQKEYWNAKLGRELRGRLVLGQPLDNELVRAIEELHDDAEAKQTLLQLMSQQEEFNRKHGVPMIEAEALPELAAPKKEHTPKVFPEGVLETLGVAERLKA